MFLPWIEDEKIQDFIDFYARVKRLVLNNDELRNIYSPHADDYDKITCFIIDKILEDYKQ